MNEKSRAKSPAATWVLWVGLGLVGYVLSFGPVVASLNGPVQGTEAQMPAETMPRPVFLLYRPLIAMMESDGEVCERLGGTLSNYCQWWTYLFQDFGFWQVKLVGALRMTGAVMT